jgi:hypothetical protein
MGLIRKEEFDSAIRSATPGACVRICSEEVARVYAESETIGGREWAFSQYRRGYAVDPELIPARATDAGRDDYTADVRRALRRLKSKLDPDALKSLVVLALVRLDAADATAMRAQQSQTVMRDQDPNQGRRSIIAVDRFISIGESLLNSKSYIARIAGLCALTGRRSIEIGCTAVFERVSDREIRFTGQAKTRERRDIQPYVIPTLCIADDALDALSSIRAAQPDLISSPELFHNRCAKELHKRIRKEFSQCFSDGKAKTKDLRAAYAEIAWQTIDKQATGKALYMQRILGHGSDDLQTAQAYDDFTITDPHYRSE